MRVPAFRVKPSKSAAVGFAALGVAILTAGIFVMAAADIPLGGVIAWVVIGVAAISFLLWSAFSTHGAVQTLETDTPPATLPGTAVDRGTS